MFKRRAKKHELPTDVHDRITAFCAEGDALAEREEFGAALERYSKAWALIPEPQSGSRRTSS